MEIRANNPIINNSAQLSCRSTAGDSTVSQDNVDKVDIGKNVENSGALKPRKEWLIMYYGAADNDLSGKLPGNIDRQERTGSGENVHMVSFIDIGSKPEDVRPFGENATTSDGKPLGYSDWKGAKTLYVKEDHRYKEYNSEVIADHGENIDSSDYKMLKNFLVDTMKKCPSEKVAIVLNSHGWGFPGSLIDEGDGKPSDDSTFTGKSVLPMPTNKIRQAMEEALKETGRDKFDVICLESCNMASAEVDYELRDVGRYKVGSEEVKNSRVWDYESMIAKLENQPDMTPEDYAKYICEINKGNQPTISAIDLSKAEKVRNAAVEFEKNMAKSGEKEKIYNAINNAESFLQPPQQIKDLYGIADNITTTMTNNPELIESAEKVKKAIDEAVIKNEASELYKDVGDDVVYKHPNAKGVSVYAPIKYDTWPSYENGIKTDFLGDSLPWETYKDFFSSMRQTGKKIKYTQTIADFFQRHPEMQPPID